MSFLVKWDLFLTSLAEDLGFDLDSEQDFSDSTDLSLQGGLEKTLIELLLLSSKTFSFSTIPFFLVFFFFFPFL